MSWEDCGYRPEPVRPVVCPRGGCSACDALHHFYAESDGDKAWFVCKHCGVTAAAVEEDFEVA